MSIRKKANLNGNSKKKKKSEPVKHSERYLLTPDAPFAIKEAYISLRTSLMFCMVADRSRSCKSFAVTSANMSEGKSVTAANVAVSLAMLGKRTMLIDADMRRPTQHRIWGARNDRGGLCDILANIDNCPINEVEGLPLSVISTGTIPPNPSELLSSDNMREFVDALQKQYEYVIIDTPPINSVADARIIAKIVDGVVLVTRSGKTTGNDFLNSVNVIRAAEGNLCGVVINGVGKKVDRSYYYYKNHHRYGYGYYRYRSSKYYYNNYYYNTSNEYDNEDDENK